jgi:hypothetical protein
MKASSHLSSLMTHYITFYKIIKSLMQSTANLFNMVRVADYSAYFIQLGEPVQGEIISHTEHARTT